MRDPVPDVLVLLVLLWGEPNQKASESENYGMRENEEKRDKQVPPTFEKQVNRANCVEIAQTSERISGALLV